ncbi:MAG TPA: hypothetical protein VK083_14970 [Nocardia sp.]|uniref:hypothetical protein n=1 Tax=Nocardia TaxID=1817 RepID=UPI0024545575|nr:MULTISPECIES: hypothetical protein [Nocardia]HLS78082.1 hypothetical protein [Nocardia sp.]
MTMTGRQATGVALGAAAGFTAYQLWDRSRGSAWPDDTAGWASLAVAALVVGLLTALLYVLVLTVRERRARRDDR